VTTTDTGPHSDAPLCSLIVTKTLAEASALWSPMHVHQTANR
jgi:hypothetical protein